MAVARVMGVDRSQLADDIWQLAIDRVCMPLPSCNTNPANLKILQILIQTTRPMAVEVDSSQLTGRRSQDIYLPQIRGL
jgi:hypothetical protein